MSEFPRFVSDAMLGSLAKWLRILGFDTLYFKDIDDNELIRIAMQQRRVLLTRDTGIAVKKNVRNFILIKSNDTFEQLKEVLNAAGIFPRENYPKYSRCANCNGELALTDKESVSGVVPEHIYLNRNSFFKCSDCGKFYWHGSHKKKIDESIRSVLEQAGWKP